MELRDIQAVITTGNYVLETIQSIFLVKISKNYDFEVWKKHFNESYVQHTKFMLRVSVLYTELSVR